MPTIINNPGPTQTDSGSGMGTGLILGIIIAILLLGIAFWVFGRPMFWPASPSTDQNTQQQDQQPDNQDKKIDVQGEIKY